LSNATPMRLSSRQTTWQCRALPSEAIASTKLSGNQIGLLTSIAAPVSEILRMTQSILLPLNSMVPAFKTRWRGEVRRSSINRMHEVAIGLWHAMLTQGLQVLDFQNEEAAG